MTPPKATPGPDAHRAFRLGILAAATVALGGIGAVYWAGMITTALLVFTVLLCFPVYLVFAAVALSVWLGFDKDATDLRPVYRGGDGV